MKSDVLLMVPHELVWFLAVLSLAFVFLQAWRIREEGKLLARGICPRCGVDGGLEGGDDDDGDGLPAPERKDVTVLKGRKIG